MTQEEIIKKAYEVYPKQSSVSEGHGVIPADHESHLLGDANADKREGYIKALTEVNSLPKIKGWAARDKDGCLNFFCSTPLCSTPRRGEVSWVLPPNPVALNVADFPDLRWEDEPIEVELLIKKV